MGQLHSNNPRDVVPSYARSLFSLITLDYFLQRNNKLISIIALHAL